VWAGPRGNLRWKDRADTKPAKRHSTTAPAAQKRAKWKMRTGSGSGLPERFLDLGPWLFEQEPCRYRSGSHVPARNHAGQPTGGHRKVFHWNVRPERLGLPRQSPVPKVGAHRSAKSLSVDRQFALDGGTQQSYLLLWRIAPLWSSDSVKHCHDTPPPQGAVTYFPS